MAANPKHDHTPEFRQALTRLTLRNDAVFFIAMLYSLRHERYDPLIIRGHRTPAATDGAVLVYDGELFSKDSLDDRQYTFVHEILHVLYFHPLRRGIREPNLWNIACDYVVNGMIDEAGAFKIPATDIQPDPAFKGLSAEQVYDLLQKEAQQALAGGKASGQGKNGRVWVRGEPGQGHGEPQSSMGLAGKNPSDLKDYDPATNDEKSAQQVEREIGIATEKAMAAAKAAGQGSSLIKLNLREAQVLKEPWYAHLRRYMNATNDRLYNWSHINRRRAALFNVVAPDMKSESLEKLVVSIDESGSLTNEQLEAISAHTLDIFKECRPKHVVVIRHTDEVTDEEIFEGPDFSGYKLERKSTGGTDFRPTFQHIHENHPDAQVILMFTDMHGPFPEKSWIDTMWITSTEEDTVATPFGERIKADFND